MSKCWFCYWGWPKPIMDIYDRAVQEIDDMLPVANSENNWTDWDGEPTCGESAMLYGPAHCVWADENFCNLDWEIKECGSSKYKDWYPGAMAIVRRSLTELAALPDELKCPPPNYDDENPWLFPPAHGEEMVKS